MRYVAEQGTISPRAYSNGSLKPMVGTSVLFDTGPAEKTYLDLVDINIEEAGDGPDGFATFWITL
jgi:2',3'-cyclic-nucleotide 2'-phosphodiesterase/3'-nucleotidase